jgi:hypothetical protein
MESSLLQCILVDLWEVLLVLELDMDWVAEDNMVAVGSMALADSKVAEGSMALVGNMALAGSMAEFHGKWEAVDSLGVWVH